jgi:hypothetical protein
MKILVTAVILCAAFAARAADTLAKELEPLRSFIGKTWKGQFKGSTPEKPKVDIAKWERALNGQAVRIFHSVNGVSPVSRNEVTFAPNDAIVVVMPVTGSEPLTRKPSSLL